MFSTELEAAQLFIRFFTHFEQNYEKGFHNFLLKFNATFFQVLMRTFLKNPSQDGFVLKTQRVITSCKAESTVLQLGNNQILPYVMLMFLMVVIKLQS